MIALVIMKSIVDDPRLAPYQLVAKPDALRSEGFFAVEGRLVVPRLLASGFSTHSVLVSESAHASLAPLLPSHPDVPVFVAPAHVINTIGGYNFHRGCLALGMRQEPPALTAMLAAANGSSAPVVVLEGVTNPDNIGGIFRSAHALGAQGVALGPRCGDPLYRKAIRTSMGATLDLPWTVIEEPAWTGALSDIRARGYTLIALTTEPDAAPLDAAIARACRPLALLLGSEGFGLSETARASADVRARIPMPHPGADSLNVSVASAIALYAASRAAAPVAD